MGTLEVLIKDLGGQPLTHKFRGWVKALAPMPASGNVTSSPPIACTVNALFCKSYLQGYQQSYAANIPYNAGYADGTKYAQHLIKICHVEKHPKIPGHHTSAYEKGWMTAYSDATGAQTMITVRMEIIA